RRATRRADEGAGGSAEPQAPAKNARGAGRGHQAGWVDLPRFAPTTGRGRAGPRPPLPSPIEEVRRMSDRSLVRAGGYAGILLAITSWAAVVAFYAGLGMAVFQLLYALIAFWALLGIAAVREVIRPSGQAWSRYATLVGSVAAIGTIAGSLYDFARVRA